MSVITIRGQYGSGAPEIGKLVAGKLKIGYVDREIIARVARELKLPAQEISQKETPPSTFLGRVAEVMAYSYPANPAMPDISLPTWEMPLDDARYLSALESAIKALAKKQPLVIRGRGSQFILKDLPDALHVLTVAPMESRVERIMQDLKLDEDSARKEIEKVDGSRREFIKRYFKAELEDPTNYDLVINTGRIDITSAAELVLQALGMKH